MDLIFEKPEPAGMGAADEHSYDNSVEGFWLCSDAVAAFGFDVVVE
jgi:hypothetical protein